MQTTQNVNIPLGYCIAPEPKSKRVQLLMKPSIHSAAKTKAKLANISLNDYINRIMEEAVSR